jgi:NADH-quinone oxidoreductase subunit N
MVSFYSQFQLILPEIFLLTAVSAILVIDLFLPAAKRMATYWLTQGALLVTAVLVFLVTSTSVGSVVLFDGLVVIDELSGLLKILICILLSVGISYSRDYLAQRDIFKGEYFSLTLFAALGMLVMVSANHLLTLYLGLELLSLSLYALVAFNRDSKDSSEAAIKYFVLGAIASGMLLYGMSMIYGSTGQLNIERIVNAISSGDADMDLLRFGLVFVVVGVGFKLGAVPFHMWVPDVYQGAPTSVTLIIGSAPKLAAFAFVVRLLFETLGAAALQLDWSPMLAILAAASLILGNLVAIAQTNLKRMLAYSTISHMGFLVLGFMTGTEQGVSAALFYVVTYAFMVVAGFGLMLLLSKRGFESDRLEDFRGLSRTHPWFAFLFLLIMFSMAGIPPMVGFWAKLFILQSIIEQGFVGLALLAVVFSLIGAFYYLRVIKLMYFDEPSASTVVEQRTGSLIMSVNGLLLLAFGLAPSWLYSLCEEVIKSSVRLF